MKFEYIVQKISANNVQEAEKKLNEWGKEGYEFKFGVPKDSNVIVILQKEKKGPGRPPKKAK